MNADSPASTAERPPWRSLGTVALAGLVGAYLVRTWGGYPICRMDEHHWAFIARAVQQGIDWPVSGPLHFWTLRQLMHFSDMSPDRALAVLGMVSVPLILAVLWAGYRMLGITRPADALLCLATSTYFLAPLLESRPQQWGQALVFLHLCLCLRALRDQRPSWPCMVLAPLVALLHILSFAILAVASFVLLAGAYLSGTRNRAGFAGPVVGLSLGLVVFVVPGTPYGAMLADIRHSQLLLTPSAGMVAGGAAVALAVLLALAKPAWPRLAPAGRHALEILDRHPRWVLGLLLLPAAGALGMQALLLPPDAWKPYKNQPALFFVAQAGNLLFLALALRGTGVARVHWLAGRGRPMLQDLLGLASAGGVLAALALVGSFWLRDTNWMLRVLNYAVLWAAPLAALGIADSRHTARLRIACCAAGAVSLVATVRPPLLFQC
ncbi:hypothetical protein [Xylophilus ampelinus]|nr:hypothetical protein [Xylophilus ampelinus]MCS4511384.1 hypothetical protein [Xylophilus ampelinus]